MESVGLEKQIAVTSATNISSAITLCRTSCVTKIRTSAEIAKMIKPCIDCTKRRKSCYNICKPYKAWKEETERSSRENAYQGGDLTIDHWSKEKIEAKYGTWGNGIKEKPKCTDADAILAEDVKRAHNATARRRAK